MSSFYLYLRFSLKIYDGQSTQFRKFETDLSVSPGAMSFENRSCTDEYNTISGIMLIQLVPCSNSQDVNEAVGARANG